MYICILHMKYVCTPLTLQIPRASQIPSQSVRVCLNMDYTTRLAIWIGMVCDRQSQWTDELAAFHGSPKEIRRSRQRQGVWSLARCWTIFVKSSCWTAAAAGTAEKRSSAGDAQQRLVPVPKGWSHPSLHKLSPMSGFFLEKILCKQMCLRSQFAC